MVNSFPIIMIVAIVLGILSGLGTGGGSLLILWLTIVVGTDPATARIVNLLFYIPSAVIASLFHIRKGNFPIRKVAPAILAGCVSAGIFSYVSLQLDTAMLKKIFGILLIFIGIREILYRPRNAR